MMSIASSHLITCMCDGVQFQWTPLLWACENGHEDVVDYLLEHNADPNAQDVRYIV